MAKVKLNDVAIEVRETWKQSKTDVPVVGLEHLEPDEIWLKRWDLNPDENTFTKGFKKGQLLFGRRRAYQKKMSVASCDGICSGDITVIAAKPEKILPDLLPFYLRTDAFFDFAVRGSGGSLSPRVKWSHISDYEFDLPPMEEQKKLAELLWAANDLKEKYKKAIIATDEMLKAKFREMFGDVGNGKDGSRGDAEARREGESGLAAKNAKVAKSKWPVVSLGDVCEVQRGVRVTRKDLNEDGNYNVYQNSMKPLGKYDIFNCEGNNPFMIMALAAGEVGYSCDPFWAADDCTYFKNLKNLNSRFLYYLLLFNQRELRRNIRQTTIPRLSNKFLESLQIPLPPLALQCEFVAIAEKAESAKTALKKSIAAIDQVMKGLINQ